jgi:thymidine kinase
MQSELSGFLKSLGFPDIRFHAAFNHYDFRKGSRRILVIGPMGSGKTEYSSRVWRDATVAQGKSAAVGAMTSGAGTRAAGEASADRRQVFFIRSHLDHERFPEYPADALAYRGGYERCGNRIAEIADSFGLEELIGRHPEMGTWIIDEAAFYDERLAYVVRRESEARGITFIFPTLVLNFRREIFNSTARLLLENATDLFPLTAYCEHADCVEDSFYTYRSYLVEGEECPALYFDPLVIIGGDRQKSDPLEPNYCTRCDAHHYLPGKDYTFLVLKPLGERAAAGDAGPLRRELGSLRREPDRSELHRSICERHAGAGEADRAMMRSLRVPCVAEKAVIYLYAEQNLLSRETVLALVEELELDREYLTKRLSDNRRPL